MSLAAMYQKHISTNNEKWGKNLTEFGVLQVPPWAVFRAIKWWTLLISADGCGTFILTEAHYEKNEMNTASQRPNYYSGSLSIL